MFFVFVFVGGGGGGLEEGYRIYSATNCFEFNTIYKWVAVYVEFLFQLLFQYMDIS